MTLWSQGNSFIAAPGLPFMSFCYIYIYIHRRYSSPRVSPTQKWYCLGCHPLKNGIANIFWSRMADQNCEMADIFVRVGDHHLDDE
jgi:hypothetical protein